ncbi:MAG: GDSL-type esterase/lipase family protein [Firmicutes bacterium]|jgi:lysophospholipase L1-like esterase|nr:GDSL-type esterase/lipase family protein [Bacillota bacterium]
MKYIDKEAHERRLNVRHFRIAYTVDRLRQFRAENNRLGQVVFLGDSITENFDLGAYGISAINRGISGDVTEGVLDRIDEVLELEPSKVFLLIGTNDLGYEYLEADEVIGNIEKIIIALDGIPLFIQSVYPIIENMPFTDAYSNEIVCEVNEGIKSLCDKYGLIYIDTARVLLDGKHLNSEFTDDGVHINDRAYKLIAEVIKDYL